VIPDIENIVCNYLRSESSVQALNARIVQKPPAKKLDPWVEVYKLDDRDETRAKPEWFLSFMVQFDCYPGQGRDPDGEGGGPPQAIALARTVRAALKKLEDTIEGGQVFKWVQVAGGPRLHDEALDRELLTATFWVHPSS
jgi:hypothetical protein